MEFLVGRNTTDADLHDLSFKDKIVSLDLGPAVNITDAGLAAFKNLTSLHLGENTNITDAGLAELQNLTSLDPGRNKNITKAGRAQHTNRVSGS